MSKFVRALAGALSLGAVAIAAAPASAALLQGNTVRVEYLFPDTNSLYEGPFDYTVGTDSTQTFFNTASVTLGDTSVQANAFCGGGCTWSGAVFSGIHISDAYNQIADFTAVTINAATNYAGFNAARVTYDANNIWINWQGLSANGQVVLDVAGGAVPEPATWALMIGGFGMAGVAMRRRRALVTA